MKAQTVLPNIALVASAGLIPRIGPGAEAMGDPLLQVLYVTLILPSLACFLNLRRPAVERHRPGLAILSVCALGAMVWYARWVILAGGVPFATGAEIQFAAFALFSVSMAGLIMGILNVTAWKGRQQAA